MTYCPLWTSSRCLPGKHLSPGWGGGVGPHVGKEGAMPGGWWDPMWGGRELCPARRGGGAHRFFLSPTQVF